MILSSLKMHPGSCQLLCSPLKLIYHVKQLLCLRQNGDSCKQATVLGLLCGCECSVVATTCPCLSHRPKLSFFFLNKYATDYRFMSQLFTILLQLKGSHRQYFNEQTLLCFKIKNKKTLCTKTDVSTGAICQVLTVTIVI